MTRGTGIHFHLLSKNKRAVQTNRPCFRVCPDLLLILRHKLLLTELLKDWNICDSSFPNDIPAHAAIAVRHQIPHPFDGPPLETVCRCLSELDSKASAQFTDLQNAKRNRAVLIGVRIDRLKGFAISDDRLFDLNTIIADVF